MPTNEERPVSVPAPGAIDCDIHPALPSMQVLVPYLDEYWRSHILMRGLERDNYTASAFPPNAPINCRPDWKPAKGAGGTDLDLLRSQALDAFGTRYAICNVLHGAQAVFSEDLSAAMCRAINDWLAAEWLAKDDTAARLDRRADAQPGTRREGDRAGGRRSALRAGAGVGDGRTAAGPPHPLADLPRRRTAGPADRHPRRQFSYRHPPTNLGWPSYYLEDYVSWSTGFAGVLNSLITEGVFVEFPRLKVVLMESGVTWLPGWMWRADKTWRGVRAEVPWLEKSPVDLCARARAADHPAVRRAADAPISCCASSRRSARTRCCCSRPTIRTGTSTTRTRCRTACPSICCARSWSTIALKTYPRLSP